MEDNITDVGLETFGYNVSNACYKTYFDDTTFTVMMDNSTSISVLGNIYDGTCCKGFGSCSDPWKPQHWEEYNFSDYLPKNAQGQTTIRLPVQKSHKFTSPVLNNFGDFVKYSELCRNEIMTNPSNGFDPLESLFDLGKDIHPHKPIELFFNPLYQTTNINLEPALEQDNWSTIRNGKICHNMSFKDETGTYYDQFNLANTLIQVSMYS